MASIFVWSTHHNRTTFQIPPDQMKRILMMHQESKNNAVIYVLVVLAVYLVALAILIGRYLHQEGDRATLLCLARSVARCLSRCRRNSKADASCSHTQTTVSAQIPQIVKCGSGPSASAPSASVAVKQVVAHASCRSSQHFSETSSDTSPSSSPSLSKSDRDIEGNLPIPVRPITAGDQSPSILTVMVCQVADTQV